IGNLTKDPELTQTSTGVSVCRFSVAVKRPFSSKDGEEQTDFFNCTAWRGLAENCGKFLAKGRKVAIDGYVTLRQYEDNNGVKKTAVDVICNDVEFLSPKQESGSIVEDKPKAKATAKKEEKKPAFVPMDEDEDIPF
ncbi:MAG: single-stranded DNA-binding protein, partial [Firmicutes bacterium]|nr:single-stranded DNA-binding protein [Candidatus Caballimonas caccae]